MDERVKLPKILKYFFFVYIGVIGVMTLTGVDMGNNKVLNIIWALSLSVYTSCAVYGAISLYEDFKKNGLKYIIRKIRRFINV